MSMVTDAGSGTARSKPNWLLGGVYLALSLIGAVGTWYFNIEFNNAGTGQNYVHAWFANAASSSAAVDVIVTAGAACLLYVVESIRTRRWWLLAFIPLTFVVALAFTLPLLLALRELLPGKIDSGAQLRRRQIRQAGSSQP